MKNYVDRYLFSNKSFCCEMFSFSAFALFKVSPSNNSIVFNIIPQTIYYILRKYPDMSILLAPKAHSRNSPIRDPEKFQDRTEYVSICNKLTISEF